MRHSILSFALLTTVAAAQSPAAKPALRPHPATQVVPHAAVEFPITRVALYKNGVGFFEHAGHVTGDQSVTIDFTSAQLNDVLQSLTAIDLNGGRITGAGYNSATPLDEQLKSLPLALSTAPSDVDFYNAIRGARVELSQRGAPSFTGRLLSIDLRPTTSADHRFVTVVSDSGQTRTVELTPAVSVTLLDTALHTDVTRYLELLASTRSQGLRHLTLLDRGTGTRDLRVSYISEVPVWKSTYRILFTDSAQTASATATIQGWSVVDNTTGTDWLNVHLDLIAGAPQSFLQPLSIPYYARRPQIGLPAEAQFAPQTHDSGVVQVNMGHSPAVGMGSGSGSGNGAGQTVSVNDSAVSMGTNSASVAMKQRPRSAGAYAAMAPGVALPAPPPPPIADYAEAAQASIAPQTTNSAFDDFFQYSISDAITIRKNESALVPILQAKLPIERVSLWSTREPHALRALSVTNTSSLTLDRGSFSIVENGNFGGEGLLDAIHPGEKRLLSYASDQALHIDTETLPSKRHVRSLLIANGVLTEQFSELVTRDYTLRNGAPEPRTVILEHARLTNHQLTADTKLLATGRPDQTIQPDETLPNAYRFRIPVAPNTTLHLRVAEAQNFPRITQIGNIDNQQIRVLILEMGSASETDLRTQLQPVLDAQRQVAELTAEKDSVEKKLDNLDTEEERQRSNIAALKDADKVAQKRFVDQLTHIEDQILELQKQQQALEPRLEAAQKNLALRVQSVQFSKTLEP